MGIQLSKQDIFLLILFVLALMLFGYGLQLDVKEKIEEAGGIIYFNYSEETSPNKLIQILEYEISEANLPEGSVCVNYSRYYNKTLSEKYPELDIRWPRYLDICNGRTLCKFYHTYILVNGYSLECILDQQSYVCLNIKKGEVYTNGKIKW